MGLKGRSTPSTYRLVSGLLFENTSLRPIPRMVKIGFELPMDPFAISPGVWEARSAGVVIRSSRIASELRTVIEMGTSWALCAAPLRGDYDFL